jgi:Uma2 family endonuclease
VLARLLSAFVDPRNLGLVSGADGMMRLFPGLVRLPDVAFASWDRIPGRRVPKEPIAGFAPDLAIEVLSESNTPGEMARKCREYFEAGVRLVWLIDPATRTATVYTAPDRSTHFSEAETLDGGDVLPGFVLPLRDCFSALDRTG